ncbi:MAG: hypothetical protein QM564_10280 [Bergeyella sp.]
MIVIFSEGFHLQIEELIEILFEKEYFGFEEDCYIYAGKIYDFVEDSIEKPISKATPEKFKKHGKFYIKYKANHRTHWYIFFNQKGNQILVNYILNNHNHDFPELI